MLHLNWAFLCLLAISALPVSAQPPPVSPTFPTSAPVTPVSLQSLLQEMTDRDRLARFPESTYSTAHASSRDRRSVAPGQPGWFSNNDSSQFLRTETSDGGRVENVLLDVEGPGAITRIWMGGARPGQPAPGTLRLYLDGAARPVLQKSADELLGGQSFVGPPLAAITSGGRNFYLPLPYASRCKLTWEGVGPCAYGVDYRTYAIGTVVRSFSPEELQAASPAIELTQATLTAPPFDPVTSPPTTTPAQKQRLEPAGSMEINLEGPAAIRRLSIKLAARDLPQALRSTILSIEFDGEPTVWCPVGDFFGSGVGLNAYRDWTRHVEPSGQMTCAWVMPFARACRVEVRNMGIQPVDVTLGPLASAAWRWDIWSMHFHANWRQQQSIRTKARDGAADWNFIEAQGAGVYVGDSLAVHNGGRAWWGDGDPKAFIDGERSPSHFGTGTADYYGFYFGDRSSIFTAPFNAQPRADGNNKPGHTTVTRCRCLDAILFSKSLKFDMEIWHWAATDLAYAATTYWYALPGARSNRPPDPVEAQRSVSYVR